MIRFIFGTLTATMLILGTMAYGQTTAPNALTVGATLTAEQKAGQFEAALLRMQEQLAQKDALISQLLAENATMREAASKTQTQALTRRLITEAKGDPDVDSWDFQKMVLVKAPAPKK
jgi:hypothetical protein